jgi:uncharacterized membrane protein YozB (DUF420 family)
MFGKGFLSDSTPFGADLNLLIQIGLGLLLLAGMGLARRGWYRAHAVCQTTALCATIAMTLAWMIPSLREIFLPGLMRGLADRGSAAVLAHVALGGVILLLGVYVVLVAGTNLIPVRLRFQNYKVWMRSLLALWWAGIGLGVLTYWAQWGARG